MKPAPISDFEARDEIERGYHEIRQSLRVPGVNSNLRTCSRRNGKTMQRLLITISFIVSPMLANAASESVNALNYSGPAWSPYLVGALIGVLAWFTFAFSDKPIGASSAYASAAGLIGKLFARKHTESLHYYKENPPKLDWEFLFVASAILGAFIAALSGGEITNRVLPPFWEERFGTGSVALRLGIGFLGGVLMALGARIAGGCTSGHGISGTLQLNVASWIAVICIFAGGALVANLLYRL